VFTDLTDLASNTGNELRFEAYRCLSGIGVVRILAAGVHHKHTVESRYIELGYFEVSLISNRCQRPGD